MLETISARSNCNMAVFLIILMALPMMPARAFEGVNDTGAAPRAVTDDAAKLIVPGGETYELSGCHTYSQSVQIDGTLKVKPFDGIDETTGTLTIFAPVITIGSSGTITADGRGYGGGGGGQNSDTSVQGGFGGSGGKGGKGQDSYWSAYGYGYSAFGGGGGGSNGGAGGQLRGTAGIETKGGDGGTGSGSTGGIGGTGFGGGGGGGGGNSAGGGAGGGGGCGGATAIWTVGGDGAGPFKGTGGISSGANAPGPANNGKNGGYMGPAANGDTSTNASVIMGSGGGGGGTSSSGSYGGGAAGGGAGGGAVTLISSGDMTVAGSVTAIGGGGGQGGTRATGAVPAGAGGGGAGGGITLSALKLTVSGTIDVRGRDQDTLSLANGGTVKLFFDDDQTASGKIQAGRTYKNGRPRMQGLLTPENDGTGTVRTDFTWKAAVDPEGDPVTYNIQVSESSTMANPVIDKAGLTQTQYTSEKDLTGAAFYWRVRAKDPVGYSAWSATWKFLTDITPPASNMNPMPLYTNTTKFTISWIGTDDSSGVATYDILVAEGTGALSFLPWLEGTPNTSASFEGKDGRKYSFYSVATDRGRNREADPDGPDAFTTVDSTPPVTTMSSLKPYQGSLNFQLSWSSRDATSGVRYYDVFMAEGDGDFELYQKQVTKTTAQFEADDGREYRFYVVACDIAGNWEAMPAPSRILKTRVDLTPPEVSLRLGTPSSGQDPVFVTAATPIYIDATDNFAGVNGTFFIIDDRGVKPYANSIKESAPGYHNLSYWCTDKAGNKGDVGSLWFFVDAESPTTSFSCEGPNRVLGDKTFVTASTTISLNAVDGGSGVNWMEYNLDKRGFVHFAAPLKFSSGTHSLLYRSVDKVGNVETEKSVTVVVDTTSPNTGPEGDYSTVSNTDLSITLGATDTESGVAGTFFRVVREKGKAGDYQAGNTVLIEAGSDGSEDANYTIQYYSVDNVNNVERVKELKVRIDTRAALQLGFTNEPSVTDSSYLLEGKTEPGAKMTVGVNDVQLSADGSFAHELSLKPGKNKVVITITDPAGNTLSKTVYITYNEPVTTTGWFLPLILVVVIAAAAGAGVFLYMRRSKGAVRP